MKTSIQDFILGTTWVLESFQSEDRDGEVVYPLGKEAKGFIMFTPENRISVHIMTTSNNSNSPKVEFLTMEEERMSELGYHAYSGPFEINEEEETLETHVEVSLMPSYVGSKQKRQVKVVDGKLHLSNVQHPQRKLIWQPLIQ